MDTNRRQKNSLGGIIKKLIFWVAAGIALSASVARAHTVSIGYVNAGPGAVTFWYSSYHSPGESPAYATEGSMRLEGINGNTFPSTVVPFNLHVSAKPAGLVAGVNNTYTGGYTDARVYRWQGATFFNLAPGAYRFTYVPRVSPAPTATWAPLGGLGSATLNVTAELLIAAPNARAGSDVTVNQGDFVTLDARASTDGNTPALPLTYAWTQLSGPTAIALAGAATATPTFTAPAAPASGAVMVFQLTVSNGRSIAPATDTVTVNIRGNAPPSANAGAARMVFAAADCKASITLSGIGSDPENGPLGFSWSGPFGVVSGAAPTVTLHKGVHTLTLTVTDTLGAAASSQVVVTVLDDTPPTLGQAAGSSIVESNGSGNVAALSAWLAGNGGATAIDNCGAITWSNNFSGLTSACGATGAATVTFTATDGSGNSTSTTATFTIVDTTAPTLVNPAASQTVESDGAGNAAALNTWLANRGGASAADANGPVTWANNHTAFVKTCGAAGAASVTFTATDACGRATTTTATFTIVDTTAPVVTAAADRSVETDGAGNGAALAAWLATQGGATATDLNGVSWTNNYTALSDGCGKTGTATVIFTATDACGNSASTNAKFTIVDTTRPVIGNAAASTTVESDGAGNAAALSAWLATHGGATATDVGSAVSWTHNYIAGSLSDGCGSTGSVPVTFTATDACGNASSTTASFTIVDTTKPVLTSNVRSISPNEKPSTFTVSSTDIGGTATPTITSVTATRANGSGKTLNKTEPYKHSVSGNKVTIETSGGVDTVWTISASAVDECGNVATATFIVNVVNPTLTK